MSDESRPVETLRNDLAMRLGSHLVADPPKRGVTGNSMADVVVRWLVGAGTSPDRQRAILDLIGLEVVDGWCYQYDDGTWSAYPYNDGGDDPSPAPVLVCRVRPTNEESS